jgi:dTDP-4-amino-4,6-dideoxygalactose transaminase
MDSLQCAVVLANLDRFDQDIAQRQAVAQRYHELIQQKTDSGQGVQLLPWPAHDRTSVFAQYSLLVRNRDGVQARLKRVWHSHRRALSDADESAARLRPFLLPGLHPGRCGDR